MILVQVNKAVYAWYQSSLVAESHGLSWSS